MTHRAALAVLLAGVALGYGGSERSAHAPTIRGRVTHAAAATIQPSAVSFVSARRGFAALRDGGLLTTTDGGSTWRRLARRVRFDLIDFLTPRRGYALTGAGLLMRTLDGGTRWSRLRLFRGAPGSGPYGGTLEFVDSRHGFVGTRSGRAFATVDSGRTWRRLHLPCRRLDYLGGLAFADADLGYAICGGQPATNLQEKELFRTTDAGRSWRLVARVAHDRPGGLPLVGFAAALAFPSARVGYLSTDRGGISRTTDGGRSWRTALFTDDAFDPADSSWLDARRGYAALLDSGLVATTDGGRTWRQVLPAPPGPPQGAVSFASRSEGIGVDTGGVLGRRNAVVATSDGGRTWAPLGTVPAEAVLRLARAPAGGVWAVARSPSRARPDVSDVKLFRSGDGGRSWTLVRTLRGTETATLAFAGEHVGYLATADGLSVTNDGGRTWSAVSRRPGLVGGLAFLTPRIGFELVRPQLSTPPTFARQSVARLKARVKAADRPVLLATRDGGRHWRKVTLGVPAFRPEALTTLGARNVWLFGSVCRTACGPGLLRSADGGASWQLVRLPVALAVDGAQFVTPTLGYAAGGAVYRTTDGGVTWGSLDARAE
jgi:photosystem II stability/assembly factor-like uncharacterized protein